jgi:hypothetical protein
MTTQGLSPPAISHDCGELLRGALLPRPFITIEGVQSLIASQQRQFPCTADRNQT